MIEASTGEERVTSRKTYHKKTSLGCKTCRKRRVKCDLGRPDCRNCIKVRRECTFRTVDPTPRSIALRTKSPTSTSFETYVAPPLSLPIPSFLDDLIRHGSLEGFTDVLRPQFTHLLQHFAKETSATISHDAMARSAWCSAVPQLTSKHRFVLQGIFATTALHLSRTVNSENKLKYFQDIATVQMSTGLIKYREVIEEITEDNCEALFSFSVTITSFVLVTTTERCQNLLHSIRSGCQSIFQRSAALEEMVRAILEMSVCFRGALVILVPCWHTLVKGPLRPILERDWWPHAIPTSPQAIEEDRKLHQLEHLWQRPGRRYEYWFDTLSLALKRLRDSFALVSQLTDNGHVIDKSAVLDWPVRTSRDFISLLEQKQPDAWIILAHFAILSSRVRAIWWVKDLAPNLLSVAALVIGEDMWSWLEWPASVVKVDLDSLRSRDAV